MYNLIFYTTARGDSPVDDFLDGLDKKSRAKVAAYLTLLEEQGPHLKRPYDDVVRGKIEDTPKFEPVPYPLFLSVA